MEGEQYNSQLLEAMCFDPPVQRSAAPICGSRLGAPAGLMPHQDLQHLPGYGSPMRIAKPCSGSSLSTQCLAGSPGLEEFADFDSDDVLGVGRNYALPALFTEDQVSSAQDDEAAEPVSLKVNGPLWSPGAIFHPDQCTPCTFFCFQKAGCRNGDDCAFCHLFHESRTQRRQREWKEARRAAKAKHRATCEHEQEEGDADSGDLLSPPGEPIAAQVAAAALSDPWGDLDLADDEFRVKVQRHRALLDPGQEALQRQLLLGPRRVPESERWLNAGARAKQLATSATLGPQANPAFPGIVLARFDL